MLDLKGFLRGILGLILGTVLYMALIWIPLLGPFITGLMAGLIARGSVKRGFLIGALSGILGFSLLIQIGEAYTNFQINGVIEFFIFWIFILWNITGVFFSSLGGALGSMISLPLSFFASGRRKGVKSDVKTFIICPNCGSSNPESSRVCRLCGKEL